MQPDKYDYVMQKLTRTLESLITHLGDVRERLISAYYDFRTLTEMDFPTEYRKDWQWVMYELTKSGPLFDVEGNIWRSGVENTMKNVRRSTGSKIAKKIFELYLSISKKREP